jgi:CHAT domain-containing protein
MKPPSTPKQWQHNPFPLRPSKGHSLIHTLYLLTALGMVLLAQSCRHRNLTTDWKADTVALPSLTVTHSIKHKIATGQRHRYRVPAVANTFIGLSLRPAEFGLLFAVYDPQGNLLRCANTRRIGETPLSLLPKVSGDYVIEISKLATVGASLTYELQWLEQRPVNSQDDLRARTQILMEEAEQLHEYQLAVILQFAGRRYQEALEGWRQLQDQREEALTSLGLGIAHYYLSQEQTAIEWLQKSLRYWHSLQDKEGEAYALVQLANANIDTGQIVLAKDAYLNALHLGESLNNLNGQATASIGLGLTYFKLGNFQQAIGYYRRALETHRKFGNNVGEITALAGLGCVYLELGEDRNTIDVAQRQLQLAQPLGLLWQTEIAHSYYGLASLHLGDWQPALENLQQALKLSLQIGDPRLEALALRRIGSVHEAMGISPKALEHYERALPITQRVNNRQEEALTLNLIGNRHEATGDKSSALAHYQQALPICQKIEDRLGEITTHHNLAHVQRDLGRLLEAQQEIERAIYLIETLRERVANRQLRESYFATVQKSYGLYVDILMRRHEQQPNARYGERAWQMNEQARARTLREMLNENRADVRAGLPSTLLEKERALQEQLNAKANRLLNGAKPEETETLAREVREASPTYAALTQPPLLSVREVQRKLLDGRTALLEYALGEERSYVWLITPQQVRSWTLANRSEIETQARHVYELLTARLQTSDKPYTERVRNADAQYWQAAAKLSTMLLPSELMAQLSQLSLLVVKDGALQYLPFSALPLLGAAKETPLLTKFEITSLPSVAVLGELRRQQATRQPRAKLLAVLADPVYKANDERLRATNTKLADKTMAAAQSSPASNELQLRTSDGSPISLMRLFNAEAEAEAIRKYATPEQCLLLKGLEVNRSVLDDPQLSDFRILHFATHGYLNSEHPELSGLALSNIRPDGKEMDGLLRMHEIYRLKLPADLVVLSACETALGKEVRGEGLIALTRGFMYAGATRVVASLWKVNDATTPQLMDHFYAGMLKENLSPAAALRKAQLEMLKNDRTRAPFYWAAFILQGEPRNFSSPPVPTTQR